MRRQYRRSILDSCSQIPFLEIKTRDQHAWKDRATWTAIPHTPPPGRHPLLPEHTHTPRPRTVCLRRLLILVYGFLTAIGEDYDGGVDGDDWPGSAVVGAVMLIIVAVLMCESWIRSKCCPPKPLKLGVVKAR